ncbi:MAG: exo-alpha-sialidase [Candidatus Eisenbacteria bacterium]
MSDDRIPKLGRGRTVLFVGTVKGLFVLHADARREAWKTAGPFFAGEQVPALALDPRDGRLYVASQSWHWGTTIRTSDDLGQHWSDPAQGVLRFPEGSGLTMEQVWQLQPGRASEPGVIYAGVAPAALFRSADRGASWEHVRGLQEHPHRDRWMPGFGGLCLHTIVLDPENLDRITVAVSAAGVYRSEDGGRSWQSRNSGIRAEFLPDKHPEFGQCVHKIVQHPRRPATLFLQNHWGLYRSDDAGDSWRDIANGVPSDFGFCMAVHPHDPDVVYIVPLHSDGYRCTPEGRLRVYRTRDGGARWEALARGLPQANAHETVLRDAMCTDTLNPAGVYFGTRSGKVFGSNDGGASWRPLADALPGVLCVRAAYLGDAARARVAGPARARRSTGARRSAPKRASAKPRARR